MRGVMNRGVVGLGIAMSLASAVADTVMAGAPSLVPDRLYDSHSVLAQVAAQQNEPAIAEAKAPSNSRVAMLYSLPVMLETPPPGASPDYVQERVRAHLEGKTGWIMVGAFGIVAVAASRWLKR